ncbi:unnamed protein product [Adineta steineri]|uniref:Uncharacterized protein n=1 Tax=Adineta steineri TaxID=433720 RepID=A0A819NQM5_9BILA|nr:unnamed protein product [Adineta steineri]CAF1191949.1 unnamed protein product [Adineta steineri]CAF4001599.1 unnamed protein product [Adineta steineri]CAF4002194.1 unnamed protein product [Adineta steineri]
MLTEKVPADMLLPCFRRKTPELVSSRPYSSTWITLLNSIKENPFDEYTNSLSSDFDVLIMGNIRFTIVDLKHDLDEADPILKNYFRICDRSRFGASKKNFMLKRIQFQEISGKPFAIFGTQIHLQSAPIDEGQLRIELRLDV